jgi:hypothetical protein
VILYIFISQIFVVFGWGNIKDAPLAHHSVGILISWLFFFYFGKSQLSKNKKPEDL